MDSKQKATGQDTFFCQSCSDSFESEDNGARRNTGARLAKVTIRGRDTVHTVAAYLPGNYKVLGMQGDDVMIGGVDNHGWTLDDYVIPRLASGMMHCEEIILDLEHILKYDPLNLLDNGPYEKRVRELEASGMTRSDAQAVADVEEFRGDL